MLILSTRRNFSVFRHGQTTWHRADVGNPPIPDEDVRLALAGRRVCVLIHGYNVGDALGAYAELQLRLYDKYDSFVGVTWPGSTLKLGFWAARWRAAESGRRIAAALAPIVLHEDTVLDIQGHSLGCRVALEALQHGLTCRNLILAAPAVGDDDMNADGRYGEAVNRAARVVVSHSKNDDVLAKAYRFALWDGALGLRGPRQPELVPPHVESWDLSHCIMKHGDYKRSVAYTQNWRRVA